MASKAVGLSVFVDLRDATSAFKDLEHGFRRSHRAGTEFGNILGGLSSELGGVGRAVGALGAALTSGGAWGVAAAGVMLIVDHFKEVGKAAAEAAKKAADEMKKLYDELYDLQKGSRAKELELQIAGTETLKRIREGEKKALEEKAAASSAGISLYGPDIDKADAAIAQLNVRLTLLNELLTTISEIEWEKALATQAGDIAGRLGGGVGVAGAAELSARLGRPYPGYGLLTGETYFQENYEQWEEQQRAAAEMERNLRPMFGPGTDEAEVEFKKNLEALEESAKRTRTLWTSVGEAVTTSFSAIGSAIGGAAGRIVASLGEIISQVIRLVVVLMSKDVLETGQWWLALPAAASVLAGLIGILGGVPKYELGTPYVPRTGLAMVHEGEAIIPARQNAGGATIINLEINAVDGASVRRVLLENDGAVIEAFAKAVRNRRG